MEANNQRYTSKEEWANTLSHGVGVLAGLIVGVIFLQKASKSADPWASVCTVVFLMGMLTSYITSSLYHGCKPGKRKEMLRKFDHAAIYFHIAASYTPFTLLVLRDSGFWGWGVFTFVWLVAIGGFILSFTRLKEHSNLETFSFIGMGCAIIVAIKPLIEELAVMDSMPVFWWLIAGGVSYIVGAIFYSFPRVKYMHFVFHLFCLGGSACHLTALWQLYPPTL